MGTEKTSFDDQKFEIQGRWMEKRAGLLGLDERASEKAALDPNVGEIIFNIIAADGALFDAWLRSLPQEKLVLLYNNVKQTPAITVPNDIDQGYAKFKSEAKSFISTLDPEAYEELEAATKVLNQVNDPTATTEELVVRSEARSKAAELIGMIFREGFINQHRDYGDAGGL